MPGRCLATLGATRTSATGCQAEPRVILGNHGGYRIAAH